MNGKLPNPFLVYFKHPYNTFTSLPSVVVKHMAKLEFGFDSFGEDYGIKTFLKMFEYKAKL